MGILGALTGLLAAMLLLLNNDVAPNSAASQVPTSESHDEAQKIAANTQHRWPDGVRPCPSTATNRTVSHGILSEKAALPTRFQYLRICITRHHYTPAGWVSYNFGKPGLRIFLSGRPTPPSQHTTICLDKYRLRLKLSSIDLSHNNFTGFSFPEFLSTNYNLKLSGDDFHAQIPSTVGKLYNLEVTAALSWGNRLIP
eukprot:Gb_17707 [translate_table: standard]